MDRLAGIFLKMRSGEINGLHVGLAVLRLHRKSHFAADNNRQFKLTDLIALRKVRIKIIFPVENRMIGHTGTDSETKANCTVNSSPVKHRQRPRKSEVNVAGVHIRFVAEMARRTRENFGMGRELNVRLKTNDNFPFHLEFFPLSVRLLNSPSDGADANQWLSAMHQQAAEALLR